MAVTTQKEFAAASAGQTAFTPVGIELNTQDDLDVYITKASAGITANNNLRVLQYRQTTTSNLDTNHPQVNDTTGLYFPALTHTGGTETLINYTISSDNNTITFNSGLAAGDIVYIERRGEDGSGDYTSFSSGSTIRAADLNTAFDEVRFQAQEARNKAFDVEGQLNHTDLVIGVNSGISFEGSIADGYETLLNVTNPTADRTVTIPNQSGNLLLSGNASIATADIADNAITNAKIGTDAVTTGKIQDNAITTQKIAALAVTTGHITNLHITTAKIADNAVTGDKINAGAVTEAKLTASAVTVNKIGDGAVHGTKLASSAVSEAKIASNAVTTAKIADANVTTAKIADNAVTTAKIPDSNITQGKLASPCVVTNHINSSAVTTAKINDQAVTEAKLANNAVTTVKITDDAVTGDKINAAAVAAEQLASNAVTTAKIADDAVTAAKIADGAITSAHIAADTVVAADIAANAVGASELADNAVDTAAIADDAVTNAKIADSAVTAASLGDNSVTTNKITDANVTSGKLATGAVIEAKIAANAVTTAKISDANVTTDKLADNSVTLAKMAGIARGKIIYGDTSGNPAVLSPGSSGQVLKTDGTDLEWGDDVASGGAGTLTIATDTSDTTCFPMFSNSTSGNVAAKVNSDFTYNASTNVLGASGLTITGDVHFDNGADAGKDILWDVSEDHLLFSDNVYAKWGNGGDLAIYHNGSHSYITDQGSGILSIQSNGTEIVLATSGGESMGRFLTDGAVELYHDGTKKFETTSGGAQVTGNLRVDGQCDLYDDKYARFGDSADLSIYHNGTNSYIKNITGGLVISTSDSGAVTIAGGANLAETIATFTDNGACEFYYDNSKKLHTNSDGIYVTGDISFTGNVYGSDGDKIRLGSSQDLELSHDGSNSIIKNSTGNLKILADSVSWRNAADGEDIAYFLADGRCELYYDNTKRIETTSGGVTVTGNCSATSKFRGNDDVKVSLGDGEDLQIYHSGSNSFIDETGTGNLLIRAAEELHLKDSDSSEAMGIFKKNGAVELYYDNTKKFETTSGGIDVAGSGSFTSHIDINSDTGKLRFGNANDLEIYHNGTVNIIDCAGANNLDIKYGTEYIARLGPNGACELYYDNSAKLTTTSSGIEVTNSAKIKGDCTFDNATNAGKDVYWNSGANQWIFYDNVKAMWGNGGDMSLHHDGTDSHIYNGTGILNIKNNDIRLKTTGDETMLRAIANGAVEVMYDNAKKLETVTGGVTVTGVCTATSFAGDGSSLTGISGADLTPAFAVRSASENSTLSSGSFTAIGFDTEDLDTDDAYDLSNHHFQVPNGEGGKYQLDFHAAVDSVDSNDQVLGAIYKDTGSGYAVVTSTHIYNKSPTNGTELSVAWSGVLTLAAADKIQFRVSHNQGSNQGIKAIGGEYIAAFSGFKIA